MYKTTYIVDLQNITNYYIIGSEFVGINKNIVEIYQTYTKNLVKNVSTII